MSYYTVIWYDIKHKNMTQVQAATDSIWMSTLYRQTGKTQQFLVGLSTNNHNTTHSNHLRAKQKESLKMCISESAIKEIHKLSDRFKLNVQSGGRYCGDNPVVFSNPAVVFIFSLATVKQISFNSELWSWNCIINGRGIVNIYLSK